jgi:hypothetical protein
MNRKGALVKTRSAFALLACVLLAVPVAALETPELTVGAGYHMLGQMDASVTFPALGYPLSGTQYGTINIRDSIAYTAALDIPLRAYQGGRIELRYCYQPTLLQFESGQDYDLFDLAVHTAVAGIFTDRAPAGSAVVPYGGVSFGCTWYDADADYDTETLFTATATLGATKYVNEKMGLTMRADLLMPINWAGGSMWVGTGGVDVGVGGTASMAQIALSLGLTYKLGS